MKQKLLDSVLKDSNVRREIREQKDKLTIPSDIDLLPEDIDRFIGIYEKEGLDGARQELGSSRVDASEAVIMRFARPSVLVANGSFDLPENRVWQDRLDTYKNKIENVIPSIGRVELRNHPSLKYVGTAWLISDDIVVTNAHVVEEFGEKNGDSFIFKVRRGRTIGATIDFQEEYGFPEERQFRVTKILNIGDVRAGEADLAFLKINRIGSDNNGNQITLTASPLELDNNFSEGNSVVAIGYPAFDSRASEHGATSTVNEIFDFKYNYKRIAPGEVISKTAIEFGHDCSTLKGNSGSPIINIETGKVIGTHFEGIFWEENYAIPSSIVADFLNESI